MSGPVQPPRPARKPRTPRLPAGDGTERWHGTCGGYSNHSCGCDPCRAAWTARFSDYLPNYSLRRRAAGLTAVGTQRVSDSNLHLVKLPPCDVDGCTNRGEHVVPSRGRKGNSGPARDWVVCGEHEG
jgi:hypothetical protein